MTDFVKISQDALRFLERDGFIKGDLGQPIFPVEDHVRSNNTPHCVGGLLNLALSDDSVTAWQSGEDAEAVYKRAADLMEHRWPSYLDSEYLAVDSKYNQDTYYHEGVIACINNHPDFTVEDARAVLAGIVQ